jgi:ferredoxin-NADP reductase
VERRLKTLRLDLSLASMILSDSTLPASLTALHLAIAALRHHRARSSWLSPFVLPSFLVAATPWIWPSTFGLVVSLCAHAVWVALCEIVAPPARAAAHAPAETTPKPAAPKNAPRPRAAAPTHDASGFSPAAVLAVLDEASEIKTFRLARPHGFEFTAGQFVPVRVSIGGKPHVRCYSISSSPDARGYIEISVRRQGLVSTTLHATLRTGSQLAIGRAAGQFVYPGADDRPLALVAGGIGITPLLSMLRHAVSSDPTRPISLLYCARDRQAMAFLPELRVLAQRFPQIRIGVTVSEPSAPAPWRTGHIDAAMVRQYVVHPSHTIFCVCGPPPMMAAMRDLLTAEGVPDDQVRSEKFDTAMAATILNAPASDRVGSVAASSNGGPTGEYQITFAGSGRNARASRSQTLLEAAEAEGISLAFSCRSGVCQACRTRLSDGDVDCRSSVLDAEDRAAGFILPCVSWAQSDCVLEA